MKCSLIRFKAKLAIRAATLCMPPWYQVSVYTARLEQYGKEIECVRVAALEALLCLLKGRKARIVAGNAAAQAQHNIQYSGGSGYPAAAPTLLSPVMSSQHPGGYVGSNSAAAHTGAYGRYPVAP